MILPIKHTVDWELICQRKKTKINKYNIQKNDKSIDHDYKFGYELILNNNVAYKYETPYKGPFVVEQFWTNVTVALQCCEKKIGIIYAVLRHIHLMQTLNILNVEN